MKISAIAFVILCCGLFTTTSAAPVLKISTFENTTFTKKKRTSKFFKKIKKRWQKRILRQLSDLTPNEKSVQRKARLGWAFGLLTLVSLVMMIFVPAFFGVLAVGSLLLSIYFSLDALRTIKETNEGHQFEKLAKNGFRMAILPLAIMFVLIGWAIGFGAW